MASIARKNLFEDIPRFIVAQAGIMFAVSLVTIQTGILNGFTRSTGLLIDQSTADLWVGSKDMLHLEVTLPIPLDRLIEARKVAGVERAEALMIRSGLWRSENGRIEPIRIFGFAPDGQLFVNWSIAQGQTSALRAPYTVLLDQANLSKLNIQQIGGTVEVSSLPVKVVGVVKDTQSMASSAAVYTSLETANALGNAGLTSEVNCKAQNGNFQCFSSFEAVPGGSAKVPPPPPAKLSLSDPISYVLIRAKPGQDLPALQRSLEAALPGTRTFTKAEMAEITRTYWQKRTGIGFVLGLGATVGIVVGMVVVGQILYSSVSDHIREFGTLKAMGASDWVIYRVITEQALWMAILGYIPSILLCVALSSWTATAKGIMILITPATALGVLGITLVMCVGSALFAIQKVTHVDPAIVFKA